MYLSFQRKYIKFIPGEMLPSVAMPQRPRRRWQGVTVGRDQGEWGPKTRSPTALGAVLLRPGSVLSAS